MSACIFRIYYPLISVGIATDYGLDGPGSNPCGGRDFPPVQTGPGAHPASCTMGTGSFPGVKCGRGVLLTTHPLLVPRSWNSRAVPLPTLWATLGCNGITLPLPFRMCWQQNLFTIKAEDCDIHDGSVGAICHGHRYIDINCNWFSTR